MRRVQVFEALPGIWCVRRLPGRACSYIVKTSPGAVLIDAGSNPTGADVMVGLQRARVGLSSIRAILLTHAHHHASAGASALKQRSGASVFCSHSEARELSRARAAGPVGRILGRAAAPQVEADGFLRNGDRVEERFEAIETPGHTPGHLAFYLEPSGTLFSGDALGGRLRRASLDALGSHDALRRLKGEVRHILPAHGGPTPPRALRFWD